MTVTRGTFLTWMSSTGADRVNDFFSASGALGFGVAAGAGMLRSLLTLMEPFTEASTDRPAPLPSLAAVANNRNTMQT